MEDWSFPHASALRNMRALLAAAHMVYGHKTSDVAWRAAGLDVVLSVVGFFAWLGLFVLTGSGLALIAGLFLGGAVTVELLFGAHAMRLIDEYVRRHGRIA